jgi:hypothetical protein
MEKCTHKNILHNNILNVLVKKGVNSGKPRTGNPEPSHKIANRLVEGAETKAEETITPNNALPEREEIVQAQ